MEAAEDPVVEMELLRQMAQVLPPKEAHHPQPSNGGSEGFAINHSLELIRTGNT
jgi:hypothetical protein